MYNFMDLMMVFTILVCCPCAIIATIAGCIIWYKRWEARDFKKEKKEHKERRPLNG